MKQYYSTPHSETLHEGTAYWKKYIISRIKNNKNFLGVFVGETGSGKSYSALSLMEALKEGDVNMKDVFMKSEDFLDRLNDIISRERKKGEIVVLLWDETGIGLNAKKWQSKINRVINAILQVFRSENIIVLFTVPFFSFIDSDARKLMHAIFETTYIDYETKECVVKPLLLQTNILSGDLYRKYLRVNHLKKGVIPVERIKLSLPSQKIIDVYEPMKKQGVFNIVNEGKEAVNSIRESRRPKKLTEKQELAVKLYKELKNQEKVAEIMNINQSEVSRKLIFAKKKLGIEDFDEYESVAPHSVPSST